MGTEDEMEVMVLGGRHEVRVVHSVMHSDGRDKGRPDITAFTKKIESVIQEVNRDEEP